MTISDMADEWLFGAFRQTITKQSPPYIKGASETRGVNSISRIDP